MAIYRTRSSAMVGAILPGIALIGGFAANAQEGRHPLVGHEAVRALIGNTLVYTRTDQPGAETGVFVDLDGTGWAITRSPDDAGTARAIRWANFSDGIFCITGPERKAWDGDCGKLALDGSLATFTPVGGQVWPGRMLEGDPWGLGPARPSAPSVNGNAAIHRLIGNTAVFIPEGGGREYRAHYFMANGMARRAHNEQPHFDNWVLQPDELWSVRDDDDRLCLSGGGWKEEFCAGIAIAGDLVTFHHPRAGPLHARLLPGDARNLSPQAEAAARKTADALVNHTLLLQAADRQASTDSIIYFMRDGTGRAKRGADAAVPIKWLVQREGKLCVVERRLDFRDNDCLFLSIDGDQAKLSIPGRPTISGQLSKGNAHNI